MSDPTDRVRVIDAGTGHEYTEFRSIVEANPEHYSTVFDADDPDHPAYDANGVPVPPVHAVAVAGAAYDGKTVEELREELKARDLPTSGPKPELLARLVEDDTPKENS